MAPKHVYSCAGITLAQCAAKNYMRLCGIWAAKNRAGHGRRMDSRGGAEGAEDEIAELDGAE
jgi:hypothetical protein